MQLAGPAWFGTMTIDGGPGGGSPWRLSPDLGLTRTADGYGVPNGPAFTADCGFFHAASNTGRIDRHAAYGRRLGPFAQLADAETDDQTAWLWMPKTDCGAGCGAVAG